MTTLTLAAKMRGLGTAAQSAYTSGSPLTLGTTNTIGVWQIPYTVFENRTGEADTETATSIDMAGHRTIDINDADHQQAIYQILGFAWRDVVGGVPCIRRYLPDYRPDWIVADLGGGADRRPFLTATRVGQTKGLSPGKNGAGYRDISVAGLPGEASSNTTRDTAVYKKVRVPIQYDFLPYDLYDDTSIVLVDFADGGTVLGSYPNFSGGLTPYNSAPTTGYCEFFSGSKMGRFISMQRKPAAEYLSIPAAVGSKDSGAGFLRWSDNSVSSRLNTVFPGNVGFIVGNIDFKFTWHQVPFDALPNKTIGGCTGRVNLRPIGLPGGQTTVALPGELLLIAVDTPLSGSCYGNRLWNVEYTFRYNPRGHNNFYDYVSGGWYQASKDGKFYGYDATTRPDNHVTYGSYYHTPKASVTNYGDPKDGVLLYDSRDFQRLFCPE